MSENDEIQYVGRQVMPRGHSRNEFYTPQAVRDYANRRWGWFDLDVAATADSTLAEWFFTEEDDALTRQWGSTEEKVIAWCNPPRS
jgi:hypothetical protein